MFVCVCIYICSCWCIPVNMCVSLSVCMYLEYIGKRAFLFVCGILAVSVQATRFMIGTEQGVILSCNRRVKNPADRITHAYGGHHGPVYAVQRNHGNFRYFLTIGDWTARVRFCLR